MGVCHEASREAGGAAGKVHRGPGPSPRLVPVRAAREPCRVGHTQTQCVHGDRKRHTCALALLLFPCVSAALCFRGPAGRSPARALQAVHCRKCCAQVQRRTDDVEVGAETDWISGSSESITVKDEDEGEDKFSEMSMKERAKIEVASAPTFNCACLAPSPWLALAQR